MITLYHDYRSYSSQKVQVYLSEKKIKWKSHPIDLLKQEHILDETYKYIHPRGIVPALKDVEVIICNSTEIMEYILKNISLNQMFFLIHRYLQQYIIFVRKMNYYTILISGL
jgi:hypothetical protein